GRGGGTMGTGLQIMPADAVLDVANGGSATLTYQVLDDGKDVTGQAQLLVDDASLGTFAGATFTAAPNRAGVTHVRSNADGLSASTSLTVRNKIVVIAPGAPADAPMHFTGPNDLSLAPALVYPPDGVLIPPNLNELEFQFTASPQTALFEIQLKSPALDLEIYTPCVPVGSGCGLLPDEATWKLLSSAATGQTVDVTLSAASASGTVGTAATRK